MPAWLLVVLVLYALAGIVTMVRFIFWNYHGPGVLYNLDVIAFGVLYLFLWLPILLSNATYSEE